MRYGELREEFVFSKRFRRVLSASLEVQQGSVVQKTAEQSLVQRQNSFFGESLGRQLVNKFHRRSDFWASDRRLR